MIFDCQSQDSCSLTKAVVAGAVSTSAVLCIISFVAGVLLHHILSPDLPCRKPRKTSGMMTEHQQNLYDAIALAEHDTPPQTAECSDSNEHQ